MAETTKRTVRQCIGSERFGIKPHKAPVADFPVQPSQKDGLGRMCKPHWRKYTAGLARDAKARKAAEAAADGAAPADATPTEPKPPRQSRRANAEQPAEVTPDEPVCSTGAADADECAMIRERQAAGQSDAIDACPIHGEHPDQQRPIAEREEVTVG